MKSPFAFFRKHRRLLTAFLTGLAMFAFIVMDQLQSRHFPAVLGVIVGAVLFWAVGRKSGKPGSYAAAGAVVGLVLGVVVPAMRAPSAPVETNVGTLTESQIEELINRRQAANNFLQAAFSRVVPPPENEFLWPLWRQRLQGYLFSVQQPTTVDQLRQDVVLGYLLGHEAEAMGISVSDDAVSDYIHTVTQKRLSEEDYRSILKELGISDAILFDAIREELKVRLALELSYPTLTSTPEEYWQDYRKLHVTQEVDVVEVPVEPFLAEVSEASDGELQAFFDRYRNVYPGNGPPDEPAFAQLRKFRIAYLQADYESVEAEISPPTDADVEAYYEENIEFYRTNPFPAGGQDAGSDPSESNPLDPGFVPESGAANPSPDEPATDDDSESPSEEDGTPGDASPAEPEEQPEPTGAEKGGPQESADQSAADSAAARQSLPPVKAPRPGDRTVDASGDMPPANEPEPTFRPLDDELRGEIREQILSERTRARMAQKIDAAAEFVTSLSEQLYAPEAGRSNDKKLEEVARKARDEFARKAKAYAEKSKLVYGETERLSVNEFQERAEEFPIVTATEPIANEFAREQPLSVLETLLRTQPTIFYQPYKADDGLGKRFAYWKVEDVAPHVPTFDEPGIREQVRTAWMRQAARPKAEQRAKKLADMLRSSDKPTSEALAGETVTGAAESGAVTVTPTPPFSWLRVSSAPTTDLFQSPRQPVISTVAGVDRPGYDFMQVVFEQLAVGDVGVTSNYDRSAYYVVKVKNRTPATAADMEALRQSFLREPIASGGSQLFGGMTPYEYLWMQQQQQLYMRWLQQLQTKYDVRYYQPVESES